MNNDKVAECLGNERGGQIFPTTPEKIEKDDFETKFKENNKNSDHSRVFKRPSGDLKAEVDTSFFSCSSFCTSASNFPLRRKNSFKGMKDSIETFISDFRMNFEEEICEGFKTSLKSTLDERFYKLKTKTNIYKKQIKEISDLIDEGGETSQPHLQEILHSLSKERDFELSKLEKLIDRKLTRQMKKFELKTLQREEELCENLVNNIIADLSLAIDIKR